MMMADRQIARFWRKVRKDGPEVRHGLGPCWLWTATKLKAGKTTTGGYGQFGLNNNNVYAHRVSYWLHYGDLPDGKQVMHSCDVRHCVNPAHLSLGTRVENMADMMAKGREARGERNGHVKLTDAHVTEIRRSFAAGEETQSALARRFLVTPANIHYIVKGRSRRKPTCAPAQD